MNIIKKLYSYNIQLLRNYVHRYDMDMKSGLSTSERERLKNFADFKSGNASFFGKPFKFSRALAFLHSVEEIFEEDIYMFNADCENPYILDCGANYGLSVYYFLKQYPLAEIIAFEPDKEIFEILKENVSYLPVKSNITLYENAVWVEDEQLVFFSEGSLGGSLITDWNKEERTTTIQAVDLKRFLNRPVDFLKIDIEGAENQVIFDIKNHLHYVKNLFLEYHGLKDKEQNLGQILSLLTESGFSYYIKNADNSCPHPFIQKGGGVYDLQLNIFCYRK